MNIRFRATDEQVTQMAANAVNASSPAGLGYLHFKGDHVFTADEFKESVTERGLSLDYVEGRMTKLNIRRLDNDLWEGWDEPRSDCQSWAYKYPTLSLLVVSAGGVVV